MNILQTILLLIIIAALLIILIFDTNIHKAEEEQSRKEIRKLKAEIQHLRADFENTPEREIDSLQEELSEFSEKFDLKMRKADIVLQEKLQETDQKIEKFDQHLQKLKLQSEKKVRTLDMDLTTVMSRIDLYRNETEDFREFIIQCETLKTELSSLVQTSKSEILDCYYDIQEKIEKLSEIPEPPVKSVKQKVHIRKKENPVVSAQEISALINKIDHLSGQLSNKEAGRRFEKIMCIILKANSFSGIKITKDSNDDGIDIFAEKNQLSYAIQCKCYLKDVDKKAIQEVASGNFKYHRDKAVAVTNRHFNSYARQFAREVHVELWEREKLLLMMARLNREELEQCIHICQTKSVKIPAAKSKSKK